MMMMEAGLPSAATPDSSEALISSFFSLSSSIQEHIYENGRQYHRKSESRYLLPSDETELDRLDLAHHMQLLMLQGELYLAPWVPHETSPRRVLDCGTDRGIWALDFAELHPGSKVLGVDLAPIQTQWVYPNVEFELDDLDQEWTFEDETFDYVYSRMVGTSIRDWAGYTRNMWVHCDPGGYVEISEHQLDTFGCDDGSVPKDWGLYQYMSALAEGLQKNGVPAKENNAEFFKRHLENAGFVEVKVREFKMPWGPWPKDRRLKSLGQVIAVFKTDAEAYGLALMTRLMGFTEEEARSVCEEMNRIIEEGKQHAYHLH
ncbi:S-adenosyl-L-methionine-dependent methyltransferase [Ascodesmis nigricans]|uniref:S-adenosyl-L-methionine-dependent methyltransferase n=1 Tax=Ascodesmis nigricans TaxID=341454 RepID=A0A4S2MLL6_9PEZI|nr:S-adenosyl-L-methionine-dependent methyltransferase [Ascodesmis nigricans]